MMMLFVEQILNNLIDWYIFSNSTKEHVPKYLILWKISSVKLKTWKDLLSSIPPNQPKNGLKASSLYCHFFSTENLIRIACSIYPQLTFLGYMYTNLLQALICHCNNYCSGVRTSSGKLVQYYKYKNHKTENGKCLHFYLF